MSSLKYNPKWLKYYGESTDDIPDGLQVGDKAYFFDTENNVVWDGSAFVDDKVNTDTTLETGDLEIGAVEIKNSTDDTRATVGANGLHVDVRSMQNALHDNVNVNANLQVGNTDVSTTNPVKVTGGASNPSVPMTRPNNTTAYAIGDVVGTDAATNLEFTSVSNIAGGYVLITGASLGIDANAIPSGMSSFRLHLYNAAPTPITDNSAYNLPSADRSKYLGYIEIYTPADLGDTLWSRVDNINMQVKLANGSTTLYGILETRGAFTPTAQCVKTVGLNILEV